MTLKMSHRVQDVCSCLQNYQELWNKKKPISQWEVREPVCFDSRCLAVHSLHTGECGDRLKIQKVKFGEKDSKKRKINGF